MGLIEKYYCASISPVLLSFFVFLIANRSAADIYTWEYIDPADPSQGRRQSTTLAADGAGVDALPGADLSSLDLSFAFLVSANLSSANFESAFLSSADLSAADLSGAVLLKTSLSYATLAGASLIDADIRAANLTETTVGGFTAAQLYSTASYKLGDLSGVVFGSSNPSPTNNDFTAWNFFGQDVSGGSFAGVNLTTADLRQATLVGTSFTNATLTGALFDDADVRRANFTGAIASGFTVPQLYSTASYKTKDLSGIVLNGDVSGANFADFNLSDANFTGANLANADLRRSNLAGARFNSTNPSSTLGATLTDAMFDDAIVRSANFVNTTAKGFSPTQLYSTASYRERDLTGINLSGNNLGGWNFAGQNLGNASFIQSLLPAADFSGAEINGANFSGSNISLAQLYSTASYQRRDLRRVSLSNRGVGPVGFSGHDLSNANFAGQNLEGANLAGALLTGADFTDATIRGANLSGVSSPANLRGISLAQLYSTASYRSGDLDGVDLSDINLAAADFRATNLGGANFTRAVLTNANFAGADICGARFQASSIYVANYLTATQLYSTASYQARDLSGVQLIMMGLHDGWNFAGFDLTNADFSFSSIAPWEALNYPGADFTNAIIRGAKFAYDGNGGTKVTEEQLYSTASYRLGDLRGIRFQGGRTGDEFFEESHAYDLSHWNFGNVNLDEAIFDNVDFGDVDFSHSRLRNARLEESRFSFSLLNFTGADLRGAYENSRLSLGHFNATTLGLFNATWTNAIRPNGHVVGLNLTAGEFLDVYDYDGDPNRASGPMAPIDVFIESSMTMDDSGVLRLIFEADAWDSTIRFQLGIPVGLGGTLELTFADDVDVAAQVGRTFRLFDWTGVSPTGAFDVFSPYTWDVSKVYTTGEVTLLAVPEPTIFLGFTVLLGLLGVRRRRSCVAKGKSLRIERLEDRRQLSITVNTLIDEADGSIVDGDISLRDAIAADAPGETIDFAVTGTIDLTIGATNSTKHLVIDKKITIMGPGA